LKTLQGRLSHEQLITIIKEADHRNDKQFLTLFKFIVKTNPQIFTKGDLEMEEVLKIFKKQGLLDKIINEACEEACKKTREETLKEYAVGSISRILSARFKVQPKTLRNKIAKIRSTTRLDELLELSAVCSTVDEFTAALG
jgi:hypothetical protein